jgi:hypothetical protein
LSPHSNFDTHFAPIATELGKLVYAWNELHEHCGELFEAVMRPKQHGTSLAVWRCTESDRTQRKMLRYATEAMRWKETKRRSSVKKDIIWLLDKSDALADGRNDAIHSPFAIFTDKGGTRIVPLYFFGNPRAIKLMDKDLITEFKWCYARAHALSGFASRMAYALRTSHVPWPDRPRLPEREAKKNHPDQRRQPQSK